MSSHDEFYIFCQNSGLNSDKPGTVEAFRRDQLGLPWEEQSIGECPGCGKPCFRISGTTKQRCIYCGSIGEIDGAVELTPKQQEAEKALKKEKQSENREKALRIWDQCVPIGDNKIVAAYLGARRLELPPNSDEVMRWHQKCPFGLRATEPCVVSLFRSVKTNEPTAIHRTRIVSSIFGKAERMALGPFFGSAIKLWPLTLGGESLTIGEGIENVLAAIKLGVGEPPAWAATVAGNLSYLPVVSGIKQLTIAADNDAHKKGQQHANLLRRKYLDRGIKVAAKIPEEVDCDFNDALIRRQA